MVRITCFTVIENNPLMNFLRTFITVSLNYRVCLNFYDYVQPFARFYLFLVFIFIYPLTILYSKACVGLLFPKYHATVSWQITIGYFSLKNYVFLTETFLNIKI